jgi:competence protein ComEC
MLIRFIPIWKSAPSVRLLPPLVAGILVQWYFQFSATLLLLLALVALLLLAACWLSQWRKRVHFGWASFLFMAILGAVLVWIRTPQNQPRFIGHHYKPGATLVATLQEPLSAKAKTYKAEAAVGIVDANGKVVAVDGNIILYFKKDSTMPPLDYGSRVVFSTGLQPLRNTGNPGAFNYERYAQFHHLFYQVYLTPGSYVVDSTMVVNGFQQLLYRTRSYVLQTFKTYIPGKAEAGLAEALLVGYRDDLDKTLVEQYANTGVVHIIAISGMHLGLIYGLLLILFKPIAKKRAGVLFSALFIIAALWFFSLLTGAAPSITRSALMFTCIVAGTGFNRKTSIYNSLSVSALLLLLVNPFNLWDVGFQLSYAAVLSIAIFGKSIENLLTPRYKLLRWLWQLIAISLAAQVLTLPLVLYHFHQFPVYFLLANLLAVPLSSLILYALLLLLLCSKIPLVAGFVGLCIQYGIAGMNAYIGWVGRLPHALIGNIYMTTPQAVVLTLALLAVAWWLFYGSSKAFVGLAALVMAFMTLRFYQHTQVLRQRQMVVYNVPGKTAIDILQGNRFTFIGDSSLLEKDFTQNFYLQPTRIRHQVSFAAYHPPAQAPLKLQLGGQTVLLLSQSINTAASEPTTAHVLMVNKAVKTKPMDLLRLVRCNTVVLDASVPNYRQQQWQIAADSLHLRLHAVQQQGAFLLRF